MSNMSYCRFRNTLSDLRDCDEALGDMGDPRKELSADEYRAFVSLVKLCQRIADDYLEDVSQEAA